MSDFSYSIPYVLDRETGGEVNATTFFAQNEDVIFEVRRHLEDAIKGRRSPKYSCYQCGQLIKIRGKADSETKLKRMHFAHPRDSDDCPIKTGQKLTQKEVQAIKYNGAKESELHKQTKELVAYCLEQNRLMEKGVTSVKTETVRRDETGLLNWRKPDVSALYKDCNVVFEIQLSTTFLSVIADREYFYRQNKTFIIWLFKRFSVDTDKQRYTEKDIFYSNNKNAFIFDGEAIAESKRQRDLILKCVYYEPYREGNMVKHRWREQLVGLSELTFDSSSYQVFYVDVEGINSSIVKEINEEEAKRQLRDQQGRDRYQLSIKKTENDFFQARSSIRQRIIERFPGPLSRSILLEEFANFSESTLDNLFDIFFKYKPTQEERAFLSDEFRREKDNRTMLERDDLLACLCLSICLTKLPQNKVYKARRMMGTIFLILSAKIGCVVGQKYTNLIQTAHSVLPSKPEFAHLFLKAVDLYSAKTIEALDTNGKFASKVAEFRSKGDVANHQYDDIFQPIFPDLF